MRFVHIDCLAQWRRLSANPLSAFQCDNCLYRYSFRRTLYSTLLRSVLVLHVVTLLLLVAAVTVGSLLTQYFDRRWLGGTILDLLPFNWSDFQLENISLSLPGSEFLHFIGVEASYFLASLTAISMIGFLTLGMLEPMLWHRDREAFFVLVIVVGIIRAFVLLYETVKLRSGRMLAAVENMVLDVGEAAPQPQPPAPPAQDNNDVPPLVDPPLENSDNLPSELLHPTDGVSHVNASDSTDEVGCSTMAASAEAS